MSPSTKKWRDLVEPGYAADPERRARVEQGAREMIAAARLVELRTAAGLTQAQLAQRLGVSQENVSRIERAEDTQLSTMRRYVEALGGTLELHAVFADRDVPLAAA